MKHEAVALMKMKPAMRGFLILAGLMILGFGVTTLYRGMLHYPNWFQQPVFAPFAVLIGIGAVAIGIRGKMWRSPKPR